MLAAAISAAAPRLAAAAPWPVFHAPGGAAISYPPDWRVAVAPSGLVVIAGPRAAWGRPVATVSVVPGGTPAEALVARAARMVGKPAALRLLGTQRFGSGREARYYLRRAGGSGSQDAYVMVGAVSGTRAAAVVVGIDPAEDPDLRVRADVFQALLLRLAVK